jgi:hypothetical protein
VGKYPRPIAVVQTHLPESRGPFSLPPALQYIQPIFASLVLAEVVQEAVLRGTGFYVRDSMYAATLYNVHWSVYFAGFSHCRVKSLQLSLQQSAYGSLHSLLAPFA